MSDQLTDTSTDADPIDGSSAADRMVPADAAAAPEDRGRLTVADGVASRIATIAAGQVDGVVSSGSKVGAVFGRQYPNVRSEVAGREASVTVDIAVAWPYPAATVAAAVRDRIRDELQRYAGLTADRVDVTVAAFQPPSDGSEGRVQ